MKSEPFCVSLYPWLREQLGDHSLDALTGTDRKALNAAVQILALYAYDDGDGALAAFGIVVRQMQPTTRHLAFHAIAHVLDWRVRAKVWFAAGLPVLHVPRCAFEP